MIIHINENNRLTGITYFQKNFVPTEAVFEIPDENLPENFNNFTEKLKIYREAFENAECHSCPEFLEKFASWRQFIYDPDTGLVTFDENYTFDDEQDYFRNNNEINNRK